MDKKRKALQISALLTAVSGVSFLMSGPAQAAADDNCWNPLRPATEELRLHGCAFIEYGLTPNVDRPEGSGGDRGGGGPQGGGGYNS